MLAAAGCAEGQGASRPQAPAPSPDSVVGTVGDAQVTLAEVDAKALELDATDFRGMSLAQALFEARQMTLDELVADRLLEAEAKKQGVSKDDFVAREATSKVAAVTDADIDKWYQENTSRLGGQPLDTVKEPIRSLLSQMRQRDAIDALVTGLRATTKVTMTLEPPRAAITIEENDPSLGPANAVVQIVEFSDFQCPFCQSVGPTLKQLRETYGDKIRLIYKDLPLENHPHAPKAAEAGNCANEQGKFWALHDVMFDKQRELSVEDIKKHAAALGLDMTAFNVCLDSGKHASTVRADVTHAQERGVTATPTFFINGRLLAGAQPLANFTRLIDDELARQKSK